MSLSFVETYASSILKYQKKRYFKGYIAIVLGLLTIFLLTFISDGLKESYQSQIFLKGDSYNFSLSRNLSSKKEGLSIVKTEAPSIKEGEGLIRYIPSLHVNYDLSFFFPEQLVFYDEDEELVARFIPLESINKQINIKGRYFNHIFSEVVVNEAFAKEMSAKSLNIIINKSIINAVDNSYIEDYFDFNQELNVVGVIDEFSFLSTPTVYYSYQAAVTYLKNHYLYNYSLNKGEVITWYNYLLTSSIESGIKGYSLKLFVSSVEDAKRLISIFNNLKGDEYILESSSLEISTILSSIQEIVDSLLFFVSCLYFILLISIITYLTFITLMEDTNNIGIMFSLGASKKSVSFSYILVSFVLGLSSLISSIVFSVIISVIANPIIKINFGLNNLLNISSFPILGFIFVFLLSIVFSLITILVFKYAFKNDIDYLIREE